MKKLLLSNLILLIAFTGFAQSGEIKGIIKDKKTGEPIFGANVYIEEGGIPQGAATDPDGKYTIKPVKSGLHTVYVSVLGYKKFELYDVKITSEKITYANIKMESAANLMDEFNVVAERFEIPLIDPDEPNVKILSAKDLKNSPVLHNPIQMVTTLSDVKLAPNGRDVYVRGSRPQSTQFITDGIKSITGDIGIPGQAIGYIKVYTGGVPAMYGDVTGGVIVVETKSYTDYAKEFAK